MVLIGAVCEIKNPRVPVVRLAECALIGVPDEKWVERTNRLSRQPALRPERSLKRRPRSGLRRLAVEANDLYQTQRLQSGGSPDATTSASSVMYSHSSPAGVNSTLVLAFSS